MIQKVLERVKWLGHSSFVYSGPPVIYFDPYGLRDGEVADLILISHHHPYHCSVIDLEKVRRSGIRGYYTGAGRTGYGQRDNNSRRASLQPHQQLSPQEEGPHRVHCDDRESAPLSCWGYGLYSADARF